MKKLEKLRWNNIYLKVLVEQDGEYYFSAEEIIESFGLVKSQAYTISSGFVGFKLTDLMAIAIEKAMKGREEEFNLAQDILAFVSVARREGYDCATIERLYFACRICMTWQEQRIEETNKMKVEEVYLIECIDNQMMKIGYSNNVNTRFQGLQASSINKLKLLSTVKGGKDLEVKLHNEFKHLKVKGEWFKWSQDIINRFNELVTLS